jgi:hypothetical protein
MRGVIKMTKEEFNYEDQRIVETFETVEEGMSCLNHSTMMESIKTIDSHFGKDFHKTSDGIKLLSNMIECSNRYYASFSIAVMLQKIGDQVQSIAKTLELARFSQ